MNIKNTPVCYTGTFLDHSGYGAANRAFVSALHIAGIDVTTEVVAQVLDRTQFGWEGELCRQLEERANGYKIKIIHLTPDMYANYKEKGKYHIGHLFWETDKLPKEWIEPCNGMDEIWTSSENMAEVFRHSGVTVPVFAFPQPIDVSLYGKSYPTFNIPHHSGFLFYSIFQWIERKNPKALIQTFWETFEGRSDVSLLLKTWRLSYSDDEFIKIRADIESWRAEMKMTHFPRLLLSKELLTTKQMMQLHNTGDCYIQTDRGEGWSRTVHEALALGKTVISTSRGGIHEYLKDEHYFRIPSTYTPVTPTPWIKFYTEDMNWAEVDREYLKKAMLFVYGNREVAHAKGLVAADFVRDNFSYHKIGEALSRRLVKIYETI